MIDQDLITRCRKGDRDAFNTLVETYQKQVFNIAYGMLSDYEDASDATQEIFVKVYKSINSFRGQSSFTTWLYRICANVCNDFLRKRQRRISAVSIDQDKDEDGFVEELKSDAPTPEEQAELNERQRAVRSALCELRSDYKEIIVYSDMRNMSYDEISSILRCPVGTVKSRLNRARNALKKKLLEKRELF